MKAMVEKMPFCSSSCCVRPPSGVTMESSEKMMMDMMTWLEITGETHVLGVNFALGCYLGDLNSNQLAQLPTTITPLLHLPQKLPCT
jgi:hypothetical protein